MPQLPWADVRKEMVEDKQLNSGVADMIGDFVKLKDTFVALATCRSI